MCVDEYIRVAQLTNERPEDWEPALFVYDLIAAFPSVAATFLQLIFDFMFEPIGLSNYLEASHR